MRFSLWMALAPALAAAKVSRMKHGAQVAQYVRDRRTAAHLDAGTRHSPPGADRAPTGRRLVLYRTHVADPLTVRILGTLADSLRGAPAYDLNKDLRARARAAGAAEGVLISPAV